MFEHNFEILISWKYLFFTQLSEQFPLILNFKAKYYMFQKFEIIKIGYFSKFRLIQII